MPPVGGSSNLIAFVFASDPTIAVNNAAIIKNFFIVFSRSV